MVDYLKSEETLANGLRLEKIREYQIQQLNIRLKEEDQILHEKLKAKDEQYKGNLDLVNDHQKEKLRLIEDFEKTKKLIQNEFNKAEPNKTDLQFTIHSLNNLSFSFENSPLKSLSATIPKFINKNDSMSLSNHNVSNVNNWTSPIQIQTNETPRNLPNIMQTSHFFNGTVVKKGISTTTTAALHSRSRPKGIQLPVIEHIIGEDRIKINNGTPKTQDTQPDHATYLKDNEVEESNIKVRKESQLLKDFTIRTVQRRSNDKNVDSYD